MNLEISTSDATKDQVPPRMMKPVFYYVFSVHYLFTHSTGKEKCVNKHCRDAVGQTYSADMFIEHPSDSFTK